MSVFGLKNSFRIGFSSLRMNRMMPAVLPYSIVGVEAVYCSGETARASGRARA